MGAEDRHRWSSFLRQGDITATAASLKDSVLYGVALIGPAGVGKTTLARGIEASLAGDTHIIRLFGTSPETAVPYGMLDLLMARLPAVSAESPTSIIHGISQLVRHDAGGRDILVVLDDLPGIDGMSMSVIMHLLLSGTARILILARHASDLPDDFLWLLKDGLLVERRLTNFTRAEVRELLPLGLGGPITGTAASALFRASGGNPLVLHALVNEQVANGNLSLLNSTWVINGSVNLDAESSLAELVRLRLSRETESVRAGVTKMALIQRAPLSVVVSVLGHEVVAEMEQRGYLGVSSNGRPLTFLTEPYIGEAVRNWLSVGEKAALFKEVSSVISPDPSALDMQDLLRFASWANDADVALDPEIALAAARAAAHLYDPILALTLSDQIPATNPLRIQAAQPRSAAYIVMADYPRAVHELDIVAEEEMAVLDIADHASWAGAMVNALVWVPEGRLRIPAILDACQARIAAGAEVTDSIMNAEKRLNLARFQSKVHYGDFAEVAAGLEAGLLDTEDREYRLNCAAMLVMVWAVCGREQEAIALARSITAEVQQHNTTLMAPDLHHLGMIFALLWSGQWHDCIAVLDDLLANLPQASQYGGGALELALGMAYTYAGRGQEAIEVLQAAAAQLEVRDSYNSANLAYCALAFAYAQVGDIGNVEKYLEVAAQTDSCTTWVNASVAKFFRLMALRWIDDPAAAELLVASAKIDIEHKRYTAASISLFGATVHGSDQEFAMLEEASLRRQGPMASLNAVLARACRSKSAAKALEAAAIAEGLDLAAVESRCAVIALEYAHDAGDNRLSREAQQRLDRLSLSIPVLPMTPRSSGVKLTQRELQVAKLAGRGLGNRAIAERIGVSVRTVEGHLYQVFAKFGIASRIELDQVKGL